MIGFDADFSRNDYQLIMGLYAAVLGLWIPLNFWMMPWHALRIGQVRPCLFAARIDDPDACPFRSANLDCVNHPLKVAL